MRLVHGKLIACLAAALVTLAARPASAQIELSGIWQPLFHEDQLERVPGPDIGDYLGLPITDAARMRALTWDASLLTLPEHQCKPHPSTYGFRGVGALRISTDVDPATFQVVKINTHIQWQEQRSRSDSSSEQTDRDALFNEFVLWEALRAER